MTVRLGCASTRDDLNQPVRVIELKTTEQTQYSSHTLPYQGRTPPETMLICTDRLDLPADVIALIYKCRHLLSHSDNGIELQIYAAITSCLLMALYTGVKPTLRTYEMFCWYLAGWADEDELMAHIEKLKPQTTD